MTRQEDRLAVADVVMATTTWPVLLAAGVGLLSAWAAGHVMAYLTVRAMATGLDMTSRAGHRRYYRIAKGYRHG